jgi:muconate cycloisomerase
MKITNIKAIPLAIPTLRPLPSSLGVALKEVSFCIVVKVETDEEIVGLGESPVLSDPEITLSIINFSKKHFLGKDPFEIEKLIRIANSGLNLIHFHHHASQGALSGVDMALWDIIGKACKRKLCDIWGGRFRSKVEFYGDITRGSLDYMRKQARELVEKGFTTLYMKVGIDEDMDVEALKAVRDEIGYNNVLIRVDANQAWSVSSAIRIIKRMERYELEMVEQPTLMHNIDGLAQVRRSVDTPILSHESSWTIYSALEVIKKEAADSIQIDPRFDVSFKSGRYIAAMAEAAGISVVMHSYSDAGISTAAAMQVIVSAPNFIHANQITNHYLKDDIIKDRLRLNGKFIDLPKGNGLGVKLDEKKVKKYNLLYDKKYKNRLS